MMTVKPALETSGLHVSYGRRAVFAGLDLALAPGRIHGIIGPNGAGKSTFMKAVLGLIPSSGMVRINGSNMRGMSIRERALEMSYLEQTSVANGDITGRQLVEMGRYARRSRFAGLSADDAAAVSDALELTGARQWADRPLAQTSGGERQLTALARALAQEAPLLMLDEPISALDLAHEMSVLALMRPWINGNGNRTVVVVLHDLTMAARFCDELVLLAPGESGAQLIHQGTPAEVLQPDALRDAYGLTVDVRVSDVTGTLAVTPLPTMPTHLPGES